MLVIKKENFSNCARKLQKITSKTFHREYILLNFENLSTKFCARLYKERRLKNKPSILFEAEEMFKCKFLGNFKYLSIFKKKKKKKKILIKGSFILYIRKIFRKTNSSYPLIHTHTMKFFT